MLGNFTFHNPTKLYFGENSLENLGKELGKYGEKVMLVYGGGSIRKNGIYDAVLAELRKAGKQTVELSGVMPNPTIEKVMEGVALARKEAVDLILAVGGGSVCDYCKAVAGSAYCEHDPWEYYFNNFGEMTCRWIPVGCVLTMAGTTVTVYCSYSVFGNGVGNGQLFRHLQAQREPEEVLLFPQSRFLHS